MKIDPIILGIIVITVVVLGGIMIAVVSSGGAPIENYEVTDAERPNLEVAERNFDFGIMKVAETKTKEIEIKNSGNKPLIVSSVFTSCDCTFAQFVIDGRESARFSMQRDQKWRGEIQPNTAATLKVIYEPRLMPVKGSVTRSIFFKTNDPQNPSVTINFTAYVK